MKRIFPIVVGILVVVPSLVAHPAWARDYGATLSAVPSTYSGNCPTKINFKGSVTAARAGKVQYRFIRSDQAIAPVHTLNFNRAGTRKVSTSWQIGRSYSGWQAIELLYPTSLKSNEARFTIRCGAPAAPIVQEAPEKPALRVVPPATIAAAVQEDCVTFNPKTIRVKRISNDWKIVDGNHWLFSFQAKEGEARKAHAIIRRYRADHSCFVGRPDPSLTYLLVGDHAPSGRIPGEDCVRFNPASATVKKISGSWKIVDGNHWLFDFKAKRTEAQTALAIIKKHGFTRSCFVGRPHPSFSYLRR